MKIEYQDEVTHRAIVKTLKGFLEELTPTADQYFPFVALYRRGKELTVTYVDNVLEVAVWSTYLKGRDMKALIEENREF